MASYRFLIHPLALLLLTQPVQGQVNDTDPQLQTMLNLCTHCHGTQGEAAVPGWPPLPSMERTELIAKLKGHRSIQSEDSTMARVTANLTDQQIEWIADYFTQIEDPSQQPMSTLKSKGH